MAIGEHLFSWRAYDGDGFLGAILNLFHRTGASNHTYYNTSSLRCSTTNCGSLWWTCAAFLFGFQTTSLYFWWRRYVHRASPYLLLSIRAFRGHMRSLYRREHFYRTHHELRIKQRAYTFRCLRQRTIPPARWHVPPRLSACRNGVTNHLIQRLRGQTSLLPIACGKICDIFSCVMGVAPA